jgi:uncharacterized protein YkwD
VEPVEPTDPDPDLGELSALLNAHNIYRSSHRVPVLLWNSKLAQAAHGHAAWMSAHNRLTHTQPGANFVDRITDAGYGRYRAAAENIAVGQRSVTQVMQGWMNSLGHRANILNPALREMGAGRVGNWWCVVFATPSAVASALVGSNGELQELALPEGLSLEAPVCSPKG